MTYRHTPAAHPDPCPWVAQLTPEQRGARGEEFEHCYSWGDGCAVSCARKRADARDRRNEARREGPRVFPMPTGGNRGKFGWCQWCGGELEGKNAKRRGWHDGREDEPNCAYEYRLRTRLEEQYAYLVDRDGERCWDCGETPLKVIRGHLITHIDWGGGRATEYVGNWCQIEIKPALDVDHEIPLWMVAHKAPDELRPFFGPENLRLRCSRGQCCHQLKTAAEATLRGHNNRMRDGHSAPKRKIKSRGFDKSLRRRMNGNVEPRHD